MSQDCYQDCVELACNADSNTVEWIQCDLCRDWIHKICAAEYDENYRKIYSDRRKTKPQNFYFICKDCFLVWRELKSKSLLKLNSNCTTVANVSLNVNLDLPNPTLPTQTGELEASAVVSSPVSGLIGPDATTSTQVECTDITALKGEIINIKSEIAALREALETEKSLLLTIISEKENENAALNELNLQLVERNMSLLSTSIDREVSLNFKTSNADAHASRKSVEGLSNVNLISLSVTNSPQKPFEDAHTQAQLITIPPLFSHF